MKKNFPLILLFILIYGVIIFYGCSSNKIFIQSGIQETPSNTILPSQTPSPTLTSINTQGFLTKTPPPAPSGLPPTWTPFPTYPPDKARQFVMDLYEHNFCRLPCWWGIKPGKTDWREAWQFLGRFAINRSPWDTLLLESKSLSGYMSFQVLLDVPQTPEEKNYYFSLNHLIFLINIASYKVDYIDVNTGNLDTYTIPRILTNYGEPKEIYAVIGEGPVSQYSGVSLLLYYPNYGLISNHFTTVDSSQFNKPKFMACFQKVTNLYLWSPEKQLDFDVRLKISGIDNITLSLLKPIDKVSDYTVDKFYQAFINQKHQPCIEFRTASLTVP